jgi:hypothetical protein
MWEKAPGTPATCTDGGRPSIQRSGTHVSASGPQMAVSRLTASMATTTV